MPPGRVLAAAGTIAASDAPVTSWALFISDSLIFLLSVLSIGLLEDHSAPALSRSLARSLVLGHVAYFQGIYAFF